jgi:hypothetical protein
MLYACTCNLSLALTPRPPGRAGDGGGGGADGATTVKGNGESASPSPSYGSLAFDPSFRAAAYEDIDLCLRAVGPPHNLPLTFAPAAEAEHAFQTFGVVSQFRRYGQHERQFTRKHPTYLGRLATSVAIVAGGRGTAAAAAPSS